MIIYSNINQIYYLLYTQRILFVPGVVDNVDIFTLCFISYILRLRSFWVD